MRGAKKGAEIASKTRCCYSCVTWRRRRKSTDEIFALVIGVLMIYTSAKFHVATCGIGRDRARKVKKSQFFTKNAAESCTKTKKWAS